MKRSKCYHQIYCTFFLKITSEMHKYWLHTGKVYRSDNSSKSIMVIAANMQSLKTSPMPAMYVTYCHKSEGYKKKQNENFQLFWGNISKLALCWVSGFEANASNDCFLFSEYLSSVLASLLVVLFIPSFLCFDISLCFGPYLVCLTTG